MMTFTVGDPSKVFRVHRNIICDKIPWFASVDEDLETGEIGMTLKDVDKSTFSALQNWLYNPTWAETLNAKDSEDIFGLLQLYCFGEEYPADELRDIVIDAIDYRCEKDKLAPSVQEMLYCYKRTEKTSPLRRLLVSLFTKKLKECEEWEENWNSSAISHAFRTSPDLTADFVESLRSENRNNPVTAQDRCKYHVHEKDYKAWYCEKKKWFTPWGVPKEGARVDRPSLMEVPAPSSRRPSLSEEREFW